MSSFIAPIPGLPIPDDDPAAPVVYRLMQRYASSLLATLRLEIANQVGELAPDLSDIDSRVAELLANGTYTSEILKSLFATPVDATLAAKIAAGSALQNDINEWWVDPVAVNGSDEFVDYASDAYALAAI